MTKKIEFADKKVIQFFENNLKRHKTATAVYRALCEIAQDLEDGKKIEGLPKEVIKRTGFGQDTTYKYLQVFRLAGLVDFGDPSFALPIKPAGLTEEQESIFKEHFGLED